MVSADVQGNLSIRYAQMDEGTFTRNTDNHITYFIVFQGWSGGAMVLGKLPVPGRPCNLDYSKARAYCAYSRCGRGLFGHFYSSLSFSPLSPSL